MNLSITENLIKYLKQKSLYVKKTRSRVRYLIFAESQTWLSKKLISAIDRIRIIRS